MNCDDEVVAFHEIIIIIIIMCTVRIIIIILCILHCDTMCPHACSVLHSDLSLSLFLSKYNE